MELVQILNKLAKFSRAGNWLPKVQISIVFAVIYLFFAQNNYFELLILFIFYQVCIASYSFILNSFSEMEIDKLAGKDFGISDNPKWVNYFVLVLLAGILLYIPSLFGNVSLFIGWCAFLLATFYSVKPIKLKEMGFAGVLAASLGAIALPFLFFVSIIQENVFLGIYLFFALFLMELIAETPHQIEDYENDKKTKTKTWAITAGKKTVRGFTKIVLGTYLIYMPLAFIFGFIQGALIFSVLFLASIQIIVNAIRL
ncbi:MAG: UbiA family prenyltransferase [archaeon]|nr:UbiA family prenyltransferase [archaeon]